MTNPINTPNKITIAGVLGSRCRQVRKALQLTQEDVAERMGKTPEFYARIERGQSLPSLTTFVELTVVLGVEPNHLLDARLPITVAPVAGADPPYLRQLTRRLRRVSPASWKAVGKVLEVLETSQDVSW